MCTYDDGFPIIPCMQSLFEDFQIVNHSIPSKKNYSLWQTNVVNFRSSVRELKHFYFPGDTG
jgi:hypothetical protein